MIERFMPGGETARNECSLDALNFFLADVREGLGPYLRDRCPQTPAGALTPATPSAPSSWTDGRFLSDSGDGVAFDRERSRRRRESH
jgi:hypothetical protein